ncbi:unnamed protein product [Auanema sp. JU1783]|nr:unnamed protein product [Auanema sp. JU1783]
MKLYGASEECLKENFTKLEEDSPKTKLDATQDGTSLCGFTIKTEGNIKYEVLRKEKRAIERSELEAKYNENLMGYRYVTDLDFSSSSDISEDEDDVYSVLKYAKEHVMKNYTPIYKQYIDFNRAYVKNEFRQHIKQYMPKRYHTFNFSPTFPDPLDPVPLNQNDFVCMAESVIGDMYPCFVQGFSSSRILPRESYYTVAYRNVVTEDRLRLSNFPYLEDLDITEKLCLDLRKLYAYGAHGEHRGWGLAMTDELLYSLLESILEEWELNKLGDIYLYRAIYKLFPNKLTVPELKNVFPRLKKRFRLGVEREATSPNCTINISDSVISYVGHSSMGTIETTQDMSQMENIPLCSIEESTEDNKFEACGPDCYKMEQDYDERQVLPNSITICKATLEPFNGYAENMFELFLRMKRHTPCQVSQIMSGFYPKQRRTCREILIMAKAKAKEEKPLLHECPKRKKTTDGPEFGLEVVLGKRRRSVGIKSEEQFQKFKVEISPGGQYVCVIITSARRGEYLGDYTGEIISKAEARRRNRVYKEFNQNFMLKLNKWSCIDATRRGNILRFAKHSDKSNCYHKPVFRNGEWSVGIYVKNGLRSGEEISVNRK